jgi:hypothetical protein
LRVGREQNSGKSNIFGRFPVGGFGVRFKPCACGRTTVRCFESGHPVVTGFDGLASSRDAGNLCWNAGDIQAISLSLATADWQSIRETSGKIRDSYIMKKTLTPAQKEELKHALPERFKHLDGAFHQRADKLAEAAANRDAEAAIFHYSRMIEGCVNCHSVYAQSRFAGFSSEKPPQHDHH